MARMRGNRSAIGFWLGNLKERDPLGSPRRRYENNIKGGIKEIF